MSKKQVIKWIDTNIEKCIKEYNYSVKQAKKYIQVIAMMELKKNPLRFGLHKQIIFQGQ